MENFKKLNKDHYLAGGDVIEINSFIESCKNGMFIDYDGHGYYMIQDYVSDEVIIYPSTIGVIPDEATHILWFNR